jgi:hypothetical protein
MGTTVEKLNAILESKEKIRQAINYKGIPVPDSTKFSEYADKIEEIQTGGGLSDSDALVFIGECAEGKRKIAKAVRSKYETITNKESGITEYSTFEELSNKISQIPVEVPLGNAMEQNGGVLPFYDVYNEALKAMKKFAGYGFNGCCAFELDKWSYDDDHKVTLSEASAYYTSDGTFIKDNIIYKNGSQIGELDNSLYRFKDEEKENANRFVVFFFDNEKYSVPTSLHAGSCLKLFCIKGTPLINLGNNFKSLTSVYVYTGDLTITSANDYKIAANTMVQTLCLPHIKEVIDGYDNVFQFGSNYNLKILWLPNLKRATLKKTFIYGIVLHEIEFPNLEYIYCYINGNFITQSNEIKQLSFPNLKQVTLNVVDGRCSFIQYCTSLEVLSLPKLEECNGIWAQAAQLKTEPIIKLGKPVGGNIRIILANNKVTQIKQITVERGFKSTLNLCYLPSLTQQCIYDIIDNLALCEGDDKDKYTITLSSSIATTEIENAIVAKGYKFGTLG